MARFRGGWLSAGLVVSLAAAQGDPNVRLRPITAPLRRAGVYHVATGTWTRGASLDASAPFVVYNNSCNVGYFTTMLSTETFQHRSRLPSPSGPTTNSTFYGSTQSDHRYDERPGCWSSYLVVGFEVEYCSSHVGRSTGSTSSRTTTRRARAPTWCRTTRSP
jgi:hypothetical protein